ncbi:hypothetical protein E0Z10_g6782 [Xylaria hypoxylon]|uniref:Proteasome assembly chaperone 3 n=1 Tax=Xylaria hypoxylon TaxID=37992 RepID=A0A4Z0YSD3_9PEZI|nr:hypothetical protein E0Z10_g6782 [Xylaria hypoxylon]
MEPDRILEEPFPAASKHETGQINGITTEATALFFADRILVTLCQEGRLSQWIQVPLSAPSPAAVDMALANESLLPMSHLTPKTLLGGGGEERESLAQLYAVQIASYIARRNSDERRTLVIGLGIQTLRQEREAFFDVLELIQKVL